MALTDTIGFMLITNILVFFIGLSGLTVTRKNILVTLMAIEVMLLAANLNFVAFSLYLDDLSGQIFVLFILTISATESVIGLALINAYFRLRGSIVFESIKSFLF
jgi:NADH-quinone oxidoreductase subunit K